MMSNQNPKQISRDEIVWSLKFEKVQMPIMTKDREANSIYTDVYNVEVTPFDAVGGRGKMCQLFGEWMEDIINELNEELAA